MPTDGTDATLQSLPRSIVACVPLLWRKVLFPSSTQPGTFRWSAVLLFLVLPGVLLYPCMGFFLFEPDEGRYAEIPREMLDRGEWVVPYLLGEPYLDKPPLLYWLVMASYRVFGVQDWAARLVSALAVHATILLIYLMGRRIVGERAAYWGALFLTLAPGFLSVGRLLVLDGVLALWITLALLAAFEATRGEKLRWGWWMIAAGSSALGILTKGPIALVLVLPPLVLHGWLNGRPWSLGWKAWASFAAVVFVVNLPWYLAVCIRLPEFAVYFFWKHNVLRFAAPFDHLEPFWYFGPILIGGMLPASLFGIAWLRFFLSGDRSDAQRRTLESGYLMLAAAWCVLFFSISGSKLPTYILPAFPPLALAFGAYFAGSRWISSRWTSGTIAASVTLLLVAHYFAVPRYASFRSPMRHADVVAGYCADSPVVCYPRNCDSVAFYLARDDLLTFRSKETPDLIELAQRTPRTVVLFTHRHSAHALGLVVEASGMKLTNLTPLSGSWTGFFDVAYCYMGVIENPRPEEVARR
jgi:4-amino-4-deoxy-L-arabinose transferase-like glycosyltransferase